MIRSAKEAREIVLLGCAEQADREVSPKLYRESVGWLACLRGPEVKALVESLETAPLDQGTMDREADIWEEKRNKALAQYREAVTK